MEVAAGSRALLRWFVAPSIALLVGGLGCQCGDAQVFKLANIELLSKCPPPADLLSKQPSPTPAQVAWVGKFVRRWEDSDCIYLEYRHLAVDDPASLLRTARRGEPLAVDVLRLRETGTMFVVKVRDDLTPEPDPTRRPWPMALWAGIASVESDRVVVKPRYHPCEVRTGEVAK